MTQDHITDLDLALLDLAWRKNQVIQDVLGRIPAPLSFATVAAIELIFEEKRLELLRKYASI